MDLPNEEVNRLRELLFKVGICPACEGEIIHNDTEPFASCLCCGTIEWSGKSPLLHRLRKRIRLATGILTN